MLFDGGHGARCVLRGDFLAAGDEVEAIDRFIVRAHVVITLGRTGVVIKGHAG